EAPVSGGRRRRRRFRLCCFDCDVGCIACRHTAAVQAEGVRVVCFFDRVGHSTSVGASLEKKRKAGDGTSSTNQTPCIPLEDAFSMWWEVLIEVLPDAFHSRAAGPVRVFGRA
ncbi:unnamed protein product, partial [Hapterophycus canaliculatus]